MDVHRVRGIPYPPSAINALAFSHSSSDIESDDPSTLRLAIGRANGNIELWNPTSGSWLQERVFFGGKDRSVEGLSWIQEPDTRDENGERVSGRLRLFSIGYSSSVTEWDLVTGLPARHSDGSHSEVWCLAAQPREDAVSFGEEHRDLIAGCADGTLVLLSTADDDLRFKQYLYRATGKKARALSVAYKSCDVVLAGFADSTIRVFDTKKNSVLRTISLGSGPVGGPKDILVWKVNCLPNGDFVAGDSTGHIRIYDGKNFSETQRIAGHEADVLDLAVSRDGTMIFSTGTDRRTCVYTCSTKKKSMRKNWQKLSHKRYHDHDVKAMATYEGSKLNVVVSGGIDTRPVVVPVQNFSDEFSRGLSSLPHTPPLVSAPDAPWVVTWWNCDLRIWRITPIAEGGGEPKVIARFVLKGDDNISSVSITRDGSLLAVTTASETKLFHVTRSLSGAKPPLKIRQVKLPISRGGKLVRLAADGKWLAVITSSDETQFLRIVAAEDKSTRPRVLDQPVLLQRISRDDVSRCELDGPGGSYSRSITHAEFSHDGTAFAVADLAGYIDTWVIEGHEDITAPEIDIDTTSPAPVDDDESDEEESGERVAFLGQQWIRNPSGHLLPQLDATPLVFSFQPTLGGASRTEPNGNPAVHPTRNNPHPRSHDLPNTEHRLLVVSAKHELYHFDVLAGRLSKWSRENPASSYPRQFRTTTDTPAKGCIWSVTEEVQRVFIYGETWMFMFDFAQNLPPTDMDDDEAEKTKKRKRQGHNGVPVAKLRKYYGDKTEDDSKPEWTVLGQKSKTVEDDEAMDDVEDALTSLRRAGSEANGELPPEEMGIEAEEDKQDRKNPWWHTFKYRPLLGIVPAGSELELSVEVVIVERPSWDISLPPRFEGNHE